MCAMHDKYKQNTAIKEYEYKYLKVLHVNVQCKIFHFSKFDCSAWQDKLFLTFYYNKMQHQYMWV